jgi:hypothetical protein
MDRQPGSEPASLAVPSWPEWAALGVTALFLLLPALVKAPRAFGDSGEYFLMSESFLNHGTPGLRPQDVSLLGARVARQPVEGAFRTLSAYRTGRGGTLYALHFWAYPVATVPVRAVLRRLGMHEYKAFQITNALLLLAAAWVWMTVLPWPRVWRMLGAALLVASPLAWFTTLPHPEVYSAALVAMALAWWRAGRPVRATLAAALASLQNPPLALLAGALWAAAVLTPSAPSSRWRRMALATAAALPVAAPFLFNLWAFGTPSIIADENTRLANVSLGRALEVLYDLNIGVLPYAPLTLLLALAATVRALAAVPFARRTVLAAWALVVAMALVCCAMNDWNHGTSGPSRYAVWLFPIVVFVLVEGSGSRPARWLPAAALLALAVQVAVIIGHGGFRAPEDYLRHSWLSRLVLRRAPALYAPSHEIFAERTAHRDWPTEGPFLYAEDGRCLKALAQKRHAEWLRERCGGEPSAFTRFQAEAVRRAGGREVWTYVDYE